MDHLKESGASIRRRRRRRRAAITLCVVAILLFGTLGWATAYFQGWIGSKVPKPVATAACHRVVSTAKAMGPSAVTVNIYNATSREGLAAKVAKSLLAQGFSVNTVANDPLGKSIKGVGEVRYGRAGAEAAAIALTRLAGALVVTDHRTDHMVDLVLGNSFKALSTPPRVTVAKAAKPKTAAC